jgi:undecaprenyl-diphosphatase
MKEKNLRKYAVVLGLLSLAVYLKIFYDVLLGKSVTALDLLINSKISIIQSPFITKIMISLTNILSPALLIVSTLLLAGFLVYRKKLNYSFAFLLAVGGGAISEFLIKFIVHRPRPQNSLTEALGYSFPSGHATIAIIFFLMLIFCFKNEIKHKTGRVIFIALSIFFFLLSGFSRIYLNVHWFSDVIAGFALGSFWFNVSFLLEPVIKNRILLKSLKHLVS